MKKAEEDQQSNTIHQQSLIYPQTFTQQSSHFQQVSQVTPQTFTQQSSHPQQFGYQQQYTQLLQPPQLSHTFK
jgi:hypothetical protein